MIKKFKTIKNLAVFNDFEWDKSVLDHSNNILEFKQNNIIYGRNYSGKTTLSRIVRAMETGFISDKYTAPSFTVSIEGNPDITEKNPKDHNKTIRVFNEDFVRKNLKFIINPDEHIESFAILGENNAKIEEEIKQLEEKLGINEIEKETGLHREYALLSKSYTEASLKQTNAENAIESKLNAKATDRKIGIKYKSERFGDQNYNRTKLLQDIDIVKAKDFKPIDTQKEKELCCLIEENILNDIPEYPTPTYQIKSYSVECKSLIEKEIIGTNKIEELLKDAILNRWAKEGYELHKSKDKICGFCGNEISSERWSKLERHFDEESSRLEKSLEDLRGKINNETDTYKKGFLIDSSLFYTKYHKHCKELQKEFDANYSKYIESLKNVDAQLLSRKKDLLNVKTYTEITDYSVDLLKVFEKYDKLREESNKYTNRLNSDKINAQKSLRLNEVYKFILTIKYDEEKNNIDTLKEQTEEILVKRNSKWEEINELKKVIESKKRLLNDEEEGAKKVNEYLNGFFGHGFLSLRAIEDFDNAIGKKRIRFEVVRDEHKAHHLSEGECSLIAFCYFMAKLHDIETKSEKPIIWIDDPISSLDGNHIFFVYSLINTEIAAQKNYEQLFISTHNLDFLKYLKRLPGAPQKEEKSKKFGYFIIQRAAKVATIQPMPIFLRHYVTEFNYLFDQIHKCANIKIVDDKNHGYFYNFGNNARKFLEVFLYYKFPDSTSEGEKLLKFFGDNPIPAILTDRINNEYSHLCGVLERGCLPIEVPEMNSAANLIIRRIKELDENQYNSLIKSIGVSEVVS